MSETVTQIMLVVLAIGTGVSVGWVLRTMHARLNPEQITRLGTSFSAQLAELNAAKSAEIAELRSAFAAERAEWHAIVNEQRAAILSRAAATDLPAPAQAHTRGPADAGEHGRIRQWLAKIGVPNENLDDIASAIERGDEDAASADPLLAAHVDGMIAERTGVT